VTEAASPLPAWDETAGEKLGKGEEVRIVKGV
jgi:hypothetical protein